MRSSSFPGRASLEDRLDCRPMGSRHSRVHRGLDRPSRERRRLAAPPRGLHRKRPRSRESRQPRRSARSAPQAKAWRASTSTTSRQKPPRPPLPAQHLLRSGGHTEVGLADPYLPAHRSCDTPARSSPAASPASRSRSTVSAAGPGTGRTGQGSPRRPPPPRIHFSAVSPLLSARFESVRARPVDQVRAEMVPPSFCQSRSDKDRWRGGGRSIVRDCLCSMVRLNARCTSWSSIINVRSLDGHVG